MNDAVRSAKLYVRHRSGSYDLVLKRGSLNDLGRFTDLVHRRVMVVSAESVPRAYGDSVLAQCAQGSRFLFPAKAQGQGMEGLQKLLDALARLRFGRGDLIVALGGGRVMGLAGLAAAIYLGGVEFVCCPTTTCAQLNACGGGLLGVELARSGYRAGVNCTPVLALVDPNVLGTVPARVYADGLAWALQIALTSTPALLGRLEAAALDIDEILWTVLNTKKKLMDQAAGWESRVQDFGGPVARAVYQVYGLHGRRSRGLLPGEALTLGMMAGVTDPKLRRRVREICRGLGLPARLTFDRKKVLDAMADDPAWQNGLLPFVTVPGAGCWHCDHVDSRELAARLNGKTEKEP